MWAGGSVKVAPLVDHATGRPRHWSTTPLVDQVSKAAHGRSRLLLKGLLPMMRRVLLSLCLLSLTVAGLTVVGAAPASPG
jgi:hypothetical protein